MSDITTRNEMATAWAPYIAVIVTIVVTVGAAAWGMAWSIGGSLAQLGAKIDGVEAKLEAKIDAVETKVDANADAIREVRDAVEANRQAMAANNAEIERLGGRLDEHRSVHAEHERRHELAAASAVR